MHLTLCTPRPAQHHFNNQFTLYTIQASIL